MRSFALAALAAALVMETACASLPGAGPTARAVSGSPSVEVVRVTAQDAEHQAAAIIGAEQAAIDASLAQLAPNPGAPDFAFGPGATLNITLWSFSPRPDGSPTPGPTALGAYQVATDGTVVLPYVGSVRLAGLTLKQAQTLVARQYAALGVFEKPSVTIEVGAVPQGHVTITGALGQPRIVPWSPAGITLGDALTQSLGDGASLLGQSNDHSNNISAIRVAVFRGEGTPVELPISVALEHTIALEPGDRVVVKKAPSVQVTVLGAGVQNNGVFGFAEPPSLAEVLAKASGLNSNAANNHAVFILRRRPGEKPVLYDFAWNRAEGLIASSRFPVTNGDLVYVAEAPVISVQRVINIVFQIALPAQVLK
jgi:polysaccharide export outer membrane protein